MLQYLLIGLGGFLGANARYLLQFWLAGRWGLSGRELSGPWPSACR